MHGTLHTTFIIVLNILAVALSIWLFLHLLRETRGGDPRAKEHMLEALKKQFAKGEINQQEFEEMKKKLVE